MEMPPCPASAPSKTKSKTAAAAFTNLIQWSRAHSFLAGNHHGCARGDQDGTDDWRDLFFMPGFNANGSAADFHAFAFIMGNRADQRSTSQKNKYHSKPKQTFHGVLLFVSQKRALIQKDHIGREFGGLQLLTVGCS